MMSAMLHGPTATGSLYTLDDPADQDMTFYLDAMHHPFPVSPLFQSFHGACFPRGYMTAARELNAPRTAFELRFRNNFQFGCIVPLKLANEEEARQRHELAEATFNLEPARLDERWRHEHLPRLHEIYHRLRAIRSSDSPTTLTPETLDELLDLYEEMWAIHFRVAFPMLVAMQLFDELFADLFGPDADAHALTAGLPSRSVTAGIALTDLAQTARSLGLAELLLDTPPAAVLHRLHDSETGREFAGQLAGFLDEYGLRQDIADFIEPTWQERPDPAIASIRGYLQNSYDNRIVHEERKRQAEAATRAAREALVGYPEPVRNQFESMLQIARDGAFLQEEHNFYIDQQGLALFRLAFLVLGERLAQTGTLNEPEDVFMLHTGEMRSGLANETPDLRPVVAARRASFVAAQQSSPPSFFGAPPAGPSPTDNPLDRAGLRFSGAPPQESGDPNQIRGTAGSRGTVTGTAFVARTLEEATSITPSQILVVITTLPPWTPLFGIAAAVVTETGGPLSHCAIVAREYGIPAVVGAHGATQRIQSGQMIEVDGTNGVITLLQ